MATRNRKKISMHEMKEMFGDNTGKSLYNLCSKFLNEHTQKKSNYIYVCSNGAEKRRLTYDKAFYVCSVKKLVQVRKDIDTGHMPRWKLVADTIIEKLTGFKG